MGTTPLHDPGQFDDLLDAVELAARDRGRPELAARLAEHRRAVGNSSCRVIVLGEFNVGKSALVNAICRCAVSPSDPVRSTTLSIEISSGDDAAALLFSESDGAVEVNELDPVTADSAATAAQVNTGVTARWMTVELPGLPFGRDTVLIDTPPLCGGFDGQMAGTILRSLPTADAFIFVTDVSQELTASQLDLLAGALEVCPNAVLVETKIDLYPDGERIIALDREHLRAARIRIPMLPFSAELHREAVLRNDGTMMRDSGGVALEALLQRDILGAGDRLALRRCLIEARTLIGHLLSEARISYDSLAGGEDAAAGAAREAELRFRHIIEAGDRWPSVLQRRFGRLVQEVRHDLVARLRSLRDNIEETLGSVDPEDLMDELEAQVHYETNRVVVEHQRTLRDQLDSLSEELSGLFHLPADAGRIAFDGPVLRTPDAPSLQRAMFEPSDESAREAWATAGRFGVSGLSASIVLATKFSMGLALAVPVGGLGIAVAAIPMATLAYRRSRKADIAKRRHELTSTIARHLDDVQFRLIHDLDGSLPTVLEEIQSYCSTIADDLRLTAARDLEAARSGAENAGVETNARLADASAALDGLLAVDRQLVEALERTGG